MCIFHGDEGVQRLLLPVPLSPAADAAFPPLLLLHLATCHQITDTIAPITTTPIAVTAPLDAPSSGRAACQANWKKPSFHARTQNVLQTLMENDLLESCKKILTKGYTGVVVSDSNGLPVFGTCPFWHKAVLRVRGRPPLLPQFNFLTKLPFCPHSLLPFLSHTCLCFHSERCLCRQLPGRCRLLFFFGTRALFVVIPSHKSPK